MACGGASQSVRRWLLQLRVIRLGFLQDGNVGISVFPNREEVLVGGAGFGDVAGNGVGASETEMGQSAQREIFNNATVVEELLELWGCGGAVVRHYLGLTQDV